MLIKITRYVQRNDKLPSLEKVKYFVCVLKVKFFVCLRKIDTKKQPFLSVYFFVDATIVTIDEVIIYFSMNYKIQQSVKLTNE